MWRIALVLTGMLTLLALVAGSPPQDKWQWLRPLMGGLLLAILALAMTGLRHIGRPQQA